MTWPRLPRAAQWLPLRIPAGQVGASASHARGGNYAWVCYLVQKQNCSSHEVRCPVALILNLD
eukprot:6994372-Prorocentrum_lima.AAC.1